MIDCGFRGHDRTCSGTRYSADTLAARDPAVSIAAKDLSTPFLEQVRAAALWALAGALGIFE